MQWTLPFTVPLCRAKRAPVILPHVFYGLSSSGNFDDHFASAYFLLTFVFVFPSNDHEIKCN